MNLFPDFVDALALPRILRAGLAVVALATLLPLSAVVHGQASCPAPTDPDRDYNCPVGPVYVTPSWGNVPWLNPEYFQTIQTGDLDGDGIDDLIARDANGLHLYMYDTALGTWKPVLTGQGGDELVLEDFSDARGWNRLETYYGSIKLAPLDQVGNYLVARAAEGLTVYQFSRGADQLGFATGVWTQVSKNGPFSDQAGWAAPPYGTSMRYGRAFPDASGTVAAWGKGGIETWEWKGNGWTYAGTTPEFGDAATHTTGVLSMQITSLDNTAPDRLLVIGENGLVAYGFEPGKGWQPKVSGPSGIFTSSHLCDAGTNTCALTLQSANLGERRPVFVARRSGCGSRARGMMGVTLDPQYSQWRVVFSTGPFDDCTQASFKDPRNFSSIMAADIDGDGVDELVGRGPGGVLAFRWNNATSGWSPMVANTPALTDAVWANEPAYWSSLRTARIVGQKHALLARGSTGMRTWLYNGTTFARTKPYGNFPALDPASYAAVNVFLQLPNGVRKSYTDDTASSVLNSYITELAGICHDEIAANPIQFKLCDPRPGAQNPAFTQAVNQLLRELTYAVASGSWFDRTNQMQAQLFSQEGIEFPSIKDNLLLDQASQTTSLMPYYTLFTNLLRVLLPLAGPEAVVAGNFVGAALSAVPLFETTQKSVLPQQFASIESTISNLQQQTQTNLLASKQHVAGDYALLSSTGQLVASQVWRIDPGAYLSASRYAFTLWVMQQLLPTLYDRWEVTACGSSVNFQFQCAIPAGTSNMYWMRNNAQGIGIDFVGILQKPVDSYWNPSPCWNGGLESAFLDCDFTKVEPPSDLRRLVFDELTPQCVYQKGAGTGWVYPTPTAPGCTLGAAPWTFINADGWNFRKSACDLTKPPTFGLACMPPDH